MKHFWRVLYLFYLVAPIACSISLYFLYQRATILLGYPPEYMINSPQSFEGDAIFDRLDNLVMISGGVSWLFAFFGSIPILISLLWPISFRSRLLRAVIFFLFFLVWAYWAMDAKGAWYLD